MAPTGIASDTVELTVRCAFQTSKDITVICPLDWTIRLLKEHLHQVCPSHPAVTSQRLIFSGACLTDDMIIRNVMDQRRVVEGAQVLHLVCPLPQSRPPELRQRHTAATAIPSSSPALPSFTTSPPSESTNAWSSSYYEWYQRYYGSNSPEQMARLQQYSGYYAAYMNQWQEYHQYMMGHLGHSAFLVQGISASDASGQPVHFGFAQGLDRDGQAHAAGQPNQDDIDVVAAAQQIPAEPNAVAAVPGGGRDVLDIIYRVFRVLLFLSAVLLYSSIERFLAVITIALFIFFIQLRRNQQRAARAADPVEPNVNNNNAGEQPYDAAAGNVRLQPPVTAREEHDLSPFQAEATFATPTPPSGIQVFFATCYSFVTSFFTSLVPDHPVPVDLN